jgi:hypothetical protein
MRLLDTRTLYKWTDKDGKTRAGYYNETQWGVGVTHTAPGNGELCSFAYLHAHTHPLLAVLFDPVCGGYNKQNAGALLWKARGKVEKETGDIVGCMRLTSVCRVPIPKVTTTQRVAFGILAVLKVEKNKAWRLWARNWLSGKDRTRESSVTAQAGAFNANPSCNAAACAAAASADTATCFVAAADTAAAAADAALTASTGRHRKLDLIVIAKQAMKVRP